MKKILILCSLLSISCLADQDLDMQKFKNDMLKNTQPGIEHKALKNFIGHWDVTFEMVMPGVPKQISKGQAEFSWLIPGRWIGQKLDGQIFGNSYQSFSMHGYDSYAKNYVTTTVSSMDNAMNTTRGLKVVADDSVQVEYGLLNEYMTGELNKPYKTVTYSTGKDSFIMELWDLSIGKDGAIVINSHYKRAKR